MIQTHETFNKRIRNYHWVYSDSNGGDIGWLLSKSDETDTETILDSDLTGVQVVGGEGAYQVIAPGFEPVGSLFNGLDQAKKAAEKYFLAIAKAG